MTTVFVGGSLNITRLHPLFRQRLYKVVTSGLEIVVGDADGADKAIQECLMEMNAAAVTVYCSGRQPRNNVGNWSVQNIFSDSKVGTRAYFTAKDLEMAQAADFGLMIWDAKSTGTLNNVIELLMRGKKCVVFLNKDKMFVTVSNIENLRQLISVMSETARNKAETKIGLSSRIADIAHEQFGLPL
jgi:hypothetical protein